MDYRNSSFRLVDIGLDLRDSTDKVGEGKWVRLKNVKSSQEGLLDTRDGRSTFFATGGGSVHSIRRIADATLLIGAGTSLYRNNILVSTGWSGSPLSIVPFRPTLSTTTWAYIADSGKLRKVKDGGTEYKWGVTAPANPASFVASVAAGNLNSAAAGAITYDWRYTYYSSLTGAESNGSPTTTAISVAGKKGEVTVNASTDPQVDEIRIYRRGGLNGGSVWRFSVSSTNTSGMVVDNNADSTIAINEALLLDNDVPFTSVSGTGDTLTEVPLPYVSGPFIGKFLLAVGDPNRPGYVYWTNPERPDSAAVENNVQVTSPREPLQGTLIYSAMPYVFSKEDLYTLDYGGPNAIPTFVGRKTPCGLGVVGPWAFCVGPAIFFVSRHGVYMTDGETPAQSITEDSLRPLFRGETVSNFSPIDFTFPEKIRLSFAGEDLHLFYQDTLGAVQHLVWSIIYQRWKSAASTNFVIGVAYQDENQSVNRLFLGASNGTVYESTTSAADDDGTAIAVNARTGSTDLEMPQTFKEFGNVIVDADPEGGTITVTPYIDSEGTALTAQTLTGTGRQKFPLSLSDTYAYSLALDFAWSGQGRVYAYDVLWRADEEAIKHWEFAPTTHGLSGWQHVRDAYLTLRSTATVTFTVEVDGVAATYTLSSTGGEKRKVYVQLSPVKGKVFRYSLDSASAFRIYGPDCELRVKQWNTGLGYQLVSPFIKLGSDGER